MSCPQENAVWWENPTDNRSHSRPLLFSQANFPLSSSLLRITQPFHLYYRSGCCLIFSKLSNTASGLHTSFNQKLPSITVSFPQIYLEPHTLPIDSSWFPRHALKNVSTSVDPERLLRREPRIPELIWLRSMAFGRYHLLHPIRCLRSSARCPDHLDAAMVVLRTSNVLCRFSDRKLNSPKLFVMGALTEIIGWAGRTWSAECPYNNNAFLMQISTLIIGAFQTGPF